MEIKEGLTLLIALGSGVILGAGIVILMANLFGWF